MSCVRLLEGRLLIYNDEKEILMCGVDINMLESQLVTR